MEQSIVRWSFEYASHVLNNLCENSIKAFIVMLTKEALIVAMTVRLNGMLGELFDGGCEEIGKRYRMALYSRSGWTMTNLMFRPLLTVEVVLHYLCASLIYEI